MSKQNGKNSTEPRGELNKLGRGQRETGRLTKCGPERAPAGLSTLTLKVSNGDSAGAHSGLNLQRVQVSAAPFQLVRHTEAPKFALPYLFQFTS